MADAQVLAHKLETLHSDVSEVKMVLRDLTAAITKLAIVEERQNTTAAALERAFKALAKVEERVAVIELQVPANKKISVWVDRVTWAGLGLMGMYVLKSLGV